LNPNALPPPPATRLALVRQMMLVDDKGEIRLSPLIESLQVRIVHPTHNKESYFYEFTLEYAPDPSLAGRSDLPGRPPGLEPPASDGPSLFAALAEQLGLKLESTKGPVSVLVIDRAEQPEAN